MDLILSIIPGLIIVVLLQQLIENSTLRKSQRFGYYALIFMNIVLIVIQ